MNNLVGKLLTCIINFVEGFAVHAEDKRQKLSPLRKVVKYGSGEISTFRSRLKVKSELFA